jgi:hypothetical protein
MPSSGNVWRNWGTLPVSDKPYQRHTLAIHAFLGFACLAVAAWNWYQGRAFLISGLVLSGLTNLLIAWEKWSLMDRGKS